MDVLHFIGSSNSSLPGAIGMLAIALGIRNIQTLLPGLVYALLSGLNSATVGLIALAGMQLFERAVSGNMTRLIVCATAAIGMQYRCMLPKILQFDRFSIVVLSIIASHRGHCNGSLGHQVFPE